MVLGLGESATATVVMVAVACSFPFFIYGAWIMLDADAVTWAILTRHLRYIAVGLTLTTVPLVGWMLPRIIEQLNGLAAVHAFLGLQAYAMLAFGFTGIVRVFRAKWAHDLYHDYDEDVMLDEIGDENLRFWRRRIRIGVFGYVIFWFLAFLTGFVRWAILHAHRVF